MRGTKSLYFLHIFASPKIPLTQFCARLSHFLVLSFFGNCCFCSFSLSQWCPCERSSSLSSWAAYVCTSTLLLLFSNYFWCFLMHSSSSDRFTTKQFYKWQISSDNKMSPTGQNTSLTSLTILNEAIKRPTTWKCLLPCSWSQILFLLSLCF